MFKKLMVFVLSGMLLLNICGCRTLVIGAVGAAAGGIGTAMWLSGKLSQQFEASYDQTVKATELALKSFNFEITKEAKQASVTTFRSHYTDGKEIWIDVRPLTDTYTKVEVRVGGVNADKEASIKILNRIKDYL